jgi:hypothetical protein
MLLLATRAERTTDSAELQLAVPGEKRYRHLGCMGGEDADPERDVLTHCMDSSDHATSGPQNEDRNLGLTKEIPC